MNHWMWLVGVVAIWPSVVAGCSPESPSVDARLEKAIRDVEQFGGPEKKSTLAALRAATAKTLKKPFLVYVKFTVKSEPGPDAVRLWLEWIEAEPSPDAVKISNPETGFERTIPISQPFIEQNALKQEGVLYYFVEPFNAESDEWKKLYSHISNGKAKAVMTKDGIATSNTVGVRVVTFDEKTGEPIYTPPR